MDFSWDVQAFTSKFSQLPAELLHVLRHGANSQLLDTLSVAALEPHLTVPVLIYFEPLALDLCMRWSSQDPSIVAASFGRIVQALPHLAEAAQRILVEDSVQDVIPDLFHTRGLGPDRLREHLLALHRLMQFDNSRFASFVRPARLQSYLQHDDQSIRALVIRVLCQYLHGSDSFLEDMKQKYLDGEAALGTWEDRVIDYGFLPLWEEKLINDTHQLLRSVRSARADQVQANRLSKVARADDLHPSVIDAAGILLLGSKCKDISRRSSKSLVSTHTTDLNLKNVAEGIRGPNALLLTGLAGCGKTSLVRQLAVELNKASTMITLHLNEQSDAKLLIGVYTTGTQPGSFHWQPGVLTTAVKEGRWVFIEDLDRAPSEIISTLLPLIERGELLIPNRGEKIQATAGFKIIATVRSSTSLEGTVITPSLSRMLGKRLWTHVALQQASSDELQHIVHQKYPILATHLPKLMAVYRRLRLDYGSRSQSVRSQQLRARPVSSRELFNWVRRIYSLLRSSGIRSGHEAVPESALDTMFLDAVDCFVGHLADSPARDSLIAVIAEELHIDPQRRDHLMRHRSVALARPHHGSKSPKELRIGRASLLLPNAAQLRIRQSHDMFAHNGHSLRLLEQVATAVREHEPLLLVGETGIGKTATIQHLSQLMEQKLVVINLSQQSESGDLLGGFKPVNLRSLAIPLKDDFDLIFDEIFSRKKNADFSAQLSKSIAKGQWKRAVSLWRVALQRIEKTFHEGGALDQGTASKDIEDERKKRRKLGSTPASTLKARTDVFTAKLELLEKQLSGPSNGFRFAFAEGALVKAVRQGDWVLLDEINLATSDTLECISDLLDSGLEASPFLMLTEAGNVERIEAHPDFRIFSAMNPASDVGKKDLPIGIRSRFTEICVESPDRDPASLLAIVQTYLSRLIEAGADRVLPVLVTEIYQDIQRLVATEGLVDGSGHSPHFSLRTLTRALSHATAVAYQCNPRRAVYEGFCLCFLTSLNPPSESRVQGLVASKIWGDGKAVRAQLRKALRAPANPEHFIEISIHVEGSEKSKKTEPERHWLPRGNEKPEDPTQYIITSYVARNLRNLIRAACTRKHPVLIQGPTSAGKTSMIEYLSKRSGNKFVRINNHEHTDLQEYLGTYVSTDEGQLKFQEGVLVEAVRKGYWIVLDELNLAPTDVLEALNRLLDDNREIFIPETQEVVKPHPNFMLFATQNPAGPYGGRKVLSRAFRNRFVELHFDDIPVDELKIILTRRSSLPPSWCEHIVEVYRRLSTLRQEQRIFEQKSFATLRDLFRWAFRQADSIEQLAANGCMLLAEKVRKTEERLEVKRIIGQVMSGKGVKLQMDGDSLYSTESCPEMALYNNTASGAIWTSSMRRLYCLVSHAIRHNEPVLLVGETGCGKTTVCQMLAIALGKPLHIINAHQNTETGDLIGSQRPIRNRAAVEEELLSDLQTWRQIHETSEDPVQDLETLLAAYDAHRKKSSTQHHLPPEIRSRIESNRHRRKALFEWADGGLVHAMRSGDFYLLDEISLAEDSVLERLNSVLDPQRSLLLAEKGADNPLVLAKEGFQFFATMNPGGGYGKKELSPALRNRFTEIWVPAVSDSDDILQIAKAKVPKSGLPYAAAMVEFARWFGQRYNPLKMTTISIRDILAWSQFLHKQELETIQAIVHGASMIYIDTLGANPSALLAFDSRNLELERRTCLEVLGSFLHCPALEIYHSPVEIECGVDYFRAGPFSVRRELSNQFEDNFKFEAPTVKQNTVRLLRALQVKKPVLLEGSPGVGKTSIILAVAKVVGKPLLRINLSDQTDLMDLFGSDVPLENEDAGNFAWRDAPFLQAMKRGYWVLLDEMNLASQSVLEGLNACLDHRGEVYVSELDKTFPRHPDFRLFAAQNPHLQGGGRKGLPASFVNRFTVVYADIYRPDDLELICSRLVPLEAHTDLIHRAVAFVSKVDEATVQKRLFGAKGAPWEFNLRDTLRWLNLLTSSSGLLPAGSLDSLLNVLFLQRFRSQADVNHLRHLFQVVFGRTAQDYKTYFNISPKTIQVGLGLLARQGPINDGAPLHQFDVRTRLPLMESLIICIQQAWPVILVGASGVGKTSLLQAVAHLAGVGLEIFPMNSDIDATDLVGGFEQADVSRNLEMHVKALSRYCREEIARLLVDGHYFEPSQPAEPLFDVLHQLHGLSNAIDWTIVIARLQRFAAFTKSERAKRTAEQYEAIANTPRIVNMAKFEWIDGILVRALEQGQWLVLDNANLCSSSVLDRLNSLLEPNGSLIVNEHCTENGVAKIVEPHPNFRIFMTMDPQYGEMSRAMRNRAVELFVPEIDFHDVQTKSCLPESSLMRLRRVLDFKAANIAEPSRPSPQNVMNAISSMLAFEDLKVLSRFASQMEAGLMPQIGLEMVQKSIQVFQRMSLLDGAWHINIKAASSFVSTCISLPHEVSESQTIHPLSNQYLVEFVKKKSSDIEPFRTGRLYDIFISLAEMSLLLETTSKLDSTPIHAMTRLQRSFAAERISHISKDSTWRVGPFLSKTLDALVQWTKGAWSNGNVDFAVARTVEKLVWLWHSLSTMTHSRDFDEASFQSLDKILKYFEVFTPAIMTTGLSMERMWKVLRPLSPRTHRQLLAVSRLEDLGRDFEEVVWRTRLPLQQILTVRRNLIESLGAALQSQDLDLEPLIQDIEAALIGISGKNSQDEKRLPFFQPVFKGICRLQELQDATEPPTKSQHDSLEFLAGRRLVSQASPDFASFQYRLEKVSHFYESTMEVEGQILFQDRLHLALIQKCNASDTVNLHCLDLLQTEVTTVGQLVSRDSNLICSDQIDMLRLALQSLIGDLIAIHNDVPRHELQSIPHDVHALMARTENLQKRVNDWFLEQGQSASWRTIGRAYVEFSRICLLLYVPDRPFDPALRSRVQRQFFDNCKWELMDRIRTLEQCEAQVPGTSTNLQRSVLWSRLEDIGEAPEFVEVSRPPVSRLDELQVEFASLVRMVKAIPAFGDEISRVVDADDQSQRALDTVLDRLQHFREYGDITTPVMYFLRCLRIGFALIDRSNIPDRLGHSLKPDDAVVLPFIEAPLEALAVKKSNKPTLSLALEHFRLRAAVIHPNQWEQDLFFSLQDEFDKLHVHWQMELEKHQKQERENTSLYQYKGGYEEDEEILEEQFQELFPSDEKAEGPDIVEQNWDPQNAASYAADLHTAIFLDGSRGRPDVLLEEMMKATARMVSTRHLCPNELARAHQMLPALFLVLLEQQEYHSSTNVRQNYNIYTDANIGEAQRLVALVYEIQDRFQTILEAWPEHSTIHNVLNSCLILLGMKHTEPVMKILPKVEEMHAHIHEWQSVTSREFSAIELFNKITELIIRWRQLELSTWARLLDLETTKSEAQAKNFWFLAYGIILRQDMQDHGSELLDSLMSLLQTSTLGQFPHRLKMLQSLQTQLRLQNAAAKSSTLDESIENLYNHFVRYLPLVQENVSKGRQGLEKALKDVVQLASWKDTNIHALKQSATTSHRKLFRIVKKYRELLNQPVGPMIQNNAVLPIMDSAENIPFAFKAVELSSEVSSILQRNAVLWNGRPNRFRNINATASMVEKKLSAIESIASSSARLDDFLDSLDASINHLQKATPSTLTEENAALCKHLTTRKRRLFADTLKEIRQMGVSSNPTTNALARQKSIPVALSSMRNMPVEVSGVKQIQNAQMLLHSSLDLIDTVRGASKEHHEDLNTQEVARCIGYAESILAVSLLQRDTLARSLTSMLSLEGLVARMASIWSANEHQVSVYKITTASHFNSLETRIKWLPTTLRVGANVLSAQQRLGSLDFRDLIPAIEEAYNEARCLSEKLDHLPRMPKNLISIQHRVWIEESQELLNELSDKVQLWAERFPLAKVTLEHISSWTSVAVHDVTQAPTDGSEATSMQDFEKAQYNVLDLILGSIQDVDKSSQPDQLEDDVPKWFMSSMQNHEATIRSFHLETIVPALSEVMHQLHRTQGHDEGNLRMACASLIFASPLIQKYQLGAHQAILRYAEFHETTCKMSYRLSKSFTLLSADGFCRPAESKTDKQASTEKLESGTGLGDGEGADDISKDIGKDEDLSELAQDQENQNRDGDMEREEDAIDIEDSLEGGAGQNGEDSEVEAKDKDDASDAVSDTGSVGGGEGEADEEGADAKDDDVGQVDDLGPSAVDEKMWDEAGDESKKEKDGDQAAKKTGNDESAAAEENSKTKTRETQDNAEELEDNEDLDETRSDSELGNVDEENQTGREEPLDAHMKESETLELPEELKLDGDKDSEDRQDESFSEDDEALGDADTMDDQPDNSLEDGREIEPMNEDSNELEDPKEDENLSAQDRDSAMEDEHQDSKRDSPTQGEDDNPDDKNDNGGMASNTNSKDHVNQEDQPNSNSTGIGPDDVQEKNDETQSSAQREFGTESQSNEKTQAATSQDPQSQPQPSSRANQEQQAIKKLGDVLEKWHRQHREIHQPASREVDDHQAPNEDVDMTEADFEHLPNENAEADTQALGGSTEEQARPLDDRMATEAPQRDGQAVNDEAVHFAAEEEEDDKFEEEDTEMIDEDAAQVASATDKQSQPQAFIGESREAEPTFQPSSPQDSDPSVDESKVDLDADLTSMSLLTRPPSPTVPQLDSYAQWQHYTHETQALSQTLTEQLRLILAPTLATKLRGDFRTGKRLNIKRIIPYIASSYKRDKIWMRRSVPSKRAYQIMLAIDDSGSMGEKVVSSGKSPATRLLQGRQEQDGDSNQEKTRASLALTTLALLTTSLTALEVGSISVLGFGASPFVAHGFASPFTSDSGPAILQQFSFQQRQTDVKKLLESAIERFAEARLAGTGGGGGGAEELWQLMLIISDGICEDHEGVRRLLVKAREERILVVFVVVDSSPAVPDQQGGEAQGPASNGKRDAGGGQSILDLEKVEFVQVEGEAGGEPEMRIKRTKYLEGFPFTYYLIVKDVQELPGVLATALRQWFAEVAER